MKTAGDFLNRLEIIVFSYDRPRLRRHRNLRHPPRVCGSGCGGDYHRLPPGSDNRSAESLYRLLATRKQARLRPQFDKAEGCNRQDDGDGKVDKRRPRDLVYVFLLCKLCPSRCSQNAPSIQRC